MSDSPGSAPIVRAENNPANTGSPGWNAALVTASIALISILSIYLLLRPPLYNYDGYTSRLEALPPIEYGDINPHHLVWYPIQKAIATVTTAIATPSPEAFQIFGILITAFTLALFCLLLVRLTGRRILPLAIAIFIAFSPRIWNLGLQNQPYPLLDFCLVLFLWAAAGWGTPTRLQWMASGAALVAAVLLQQAMALAIPAVALGILLAGIGPIKDRFKLAAFWAGGTTLGVAVAYVLMARIAGIKPAGFINWTLMYLQEQHSIQLHWPQSAIKSIIGIVSTVVETSRFRDTFDSPENAATIWRLFGGLLLVGSIATVTLLVRPRVRVRLTRLLRSDAAFTSTLLLTLAWSVFVFLWEPTGYYWSVNLFPLAFLASWWIRASRKQIALAIAGVLMVVSGWNLYADHQRDTAMSVNYPPPLLEQIRAQLGPADVFIVAGRDWYANIDYSLLLECLDDWPRDPALPLLDNYVMKGSREQWQQRLDADIRKAFAAGGRVYVADHVFWPDSYRDLEQTADPFSEYAHMEYAGLGGEKLSDEIREFFSRYKLTKSEFKIAGDRFWELKRIE